MKKEIGWWEAQVLNDIKTLEQKLEMARKSLITIGSIAGDEEIQTIVWDTIDKIGGIDDVKR